MYDEIKNCGGAVNVPITKELIKYANSARRMYRDHLKEERKKKIASEEKLKRKRIEDEIENLKKRQKVIEEVIEGLENSADKLLLEARKSKSTLCIEKKQKLSEANALRAKRKRKSWCLLGKNLQRKKTT